MKLKPAGQYLAFVLLAVCRCQSLAANVAWSDPTAISGREDVCTHWSLDRAYAMGSRNQIAVNGVTFMPFKAPNLHEVNPLPEGILDDKTEIMVSGDGDGIFADQEPSLDGLNALPLGYRTLLGSGLLDSGSACALTLGGLSTGKTYLLQIWMNDSRNSSATETLAGGDGISAKVRFNTTATEGGMGQYIIGIFVADDTRQTITFTPDHGAARINAIQVRVAPPDGKLAFVKQPAPASNYLGKTVKLSVLAAGRNSVTYQWQKIAAGSVKTLYDNDKFSGTATSSMTIQDLVPDDVGSYQVLVSDETGSLASDKTSVSTLLPPANQLINVDINSDSSATYQGDGILVGNSSFDVWNGIDGQGGFTNVDLVDSTGAKTPVTLTLSKPVKVGSASGNTRNDLLKDYSSAEIQAVSLNNLEPDSYYNLVVYSIGGAQNEGGVFSGAVEGVVRGGSDSSDLWKERFWLGTNYMQNPFARSDANGTLQFNIAATSSVFSDGSPNGIFNGLQIAKVATNGLVPFILQQSKSVSAYRNRSATLTVNAVGPPSARLTYRLTYQWQKISSVATNNLVDADYVHGSTNRMLILSNLTSYDAGIYRVVVGDKSVTATSAVASVSVMSMPHLINVDIRNGVSPIYTGKGVLTEGRGNEFWNGIDGRNSFTNVPLSDFTGAATPFTLTLIKDYVDAGWTSVIGTNNLLKNYSVGGSQTVILNNLEPNAHYDLVVYCMGQATNEGGVLSGAIEGIIRGGDGSPVGSFVNSFESGTNYLENPSALSDAQGTLTFIIEPTATVARNGFPNSDFNGLQIMKTEP